MWWWFIIHIFQQCHVIYLILWFFHCMQICKNIDLLFKCAVSLWQLWSFNIWDIENRIFKCICTLCYVVVIHYSHFSAVYELCHVIYLILWCFHCMLWVCDSCGVSIIWHMKNCTLHSVMWWWFIIHIFQQYISCVMWFIWFYDFFIVCRFLLQMTLV